jgi:hypothetical protein
MVIRITPETQQFLNLCSQANTLADEAERRFSAWLSSVTVAYAQAWSDHTRVLKDIELQARLVNDLILNAALAFIPGGAGGLIGDSMKRLTTASFLIDGAKDLGKWGMRSGAIVGLPGGFSFPSAPALRAFPTDPLVWSNNVNIRVQSEMAAVTQAIEGWQDAVNRGDANFQANFNPVEKARAALILNPPDEPSRALIDLVPVHVAEMEKNFEAGFLATWIDKFSFEASSSMSPAAWDGIFGDGARQKLIKYGNSVGIPDTSKLIQDAYNRDYQEHNRRAIASGHGLI